MSGFREFRDFRAAAGRAAVAGESDSPCDILQRLAQTIQLMRQEPVDAELSRDGCEDLMRRAVAVSRWSGLARALAQIKRLIEQSDYHWALGELRAIMQPEWHSC